MIVKNNPCKKDCPNRNSECHSIRPEYLLYEKEHRAEIEERTPSLNELMHWNITKYRKAMKSRR